ncbi:response regulator [Paludisphaera mucosa]|uniref:Response regulator n=1 Tax=Paludisphaera mucosa TaxID=3030827 RepID=A0ABT6FCX1_9BACT|nr:response regulator [Paludisphaera mucosa]MDG3005438.1 response regulator [Paludisphaera mucosa]
MDSASEGPPRTRCSPPEDWTDARVLITDDEPNVRTACRFLLEADGIACDEAVDGLQALKAATTCSYDAVILDVDMPRLKGPEVCRRLRVADPSSHLKIIMVSGRATPDEMALMLSAGADDYLGKPFTAIQLQQRVKAALRRKGQQDCADRLNSELQLVNRGLEQAAGGRARNLNVDEARETLVRGLAKLAECRDLETGSHLLRLRHYSVCLAEELAETPGVGDGPIDQAFIDLLGCCAPLHDIGKVGLPDHILRNPGRLDQDERRVMETHTLIGYEALKSLLDRSGFAVDLLAMGMDIARHHHERFDGSGYPDRLAAGQIPLAARVVAICDVYDALRSRRVYKAAMPHDEVVRAMSNPADGSFDPHLLRLFLRSSHRFERIFADFENDADCSAGDLGRGGGDQRIGAA